MINATTSEHIARAEQIAINTKSLDELQRAQSVLLTIGHKMTLKEAAKAIGKSPNWVAHARKAFIEAGVTSRSHNYGGRRNQILSESEEASFMEEACKRYRELLASGRWPIFQRPKELQIHRVVRDMLEERAGRTVSNSTAFSLMARVGKRKFSNYYARQWTYYA